MRESTCLFVGNLSYNVRERELREYMERCGRVKSVTVGVNTNTGQSKGYGFVEFEDRRDAEEAFEKYHGLEIDGRKLRIDWDLGIDKKMSMPATGREEHLSGEVDVDLDTLHDPLADVDILPLLAALPPVDLVLLVVPALPAALSLVPAPDQDLRFTNVVGAPLKAGLHQRQKDNETIIKHKVLVEEFKWMLGS